MKKLLFTILLCSLFLSCMTPARVLTEGEDEKDVNSTTAYDISDSYQRLSFTIMEKQAPELGLSTQSNESFVLLFNLNKGLVFSQDLVELGYLDGINDEYIFFVLDTGNTYITEYSISSEKGIFICNFIDKESNNVFRVDKGFVEFID